MKKISCIISALNEEPRIADVLKAVSNHPLIDEIIVVDDGSTDNTSKEALKFKDVKVIRHEKNKGKTRSMLEGCYNTENDLVLFLDADLVDLNSDNISQLVKPVLNGSVDMTIGMIKHDTRLYITATILLYGCFSGQRAMKKEIALNTLENVIGYGAEATFNKYVLDNNLKFIIVNWLNVKAILRYKETGFRKGVSSFLLTLKDMFIVAPPLKFLKQVLLMRKLSKKYKKLIKND
jgi:glycosyltransferase involved in cell wall biosynthesis